jgi:hypothetical protein
MMAKVRLRSISGWRAIFSSERIIIRFLYAGFNKRARIVKQ